MDKSIFSWASLFIAFMFITPPIGLGQDFKPIQLLNPQTDGGRPLMQALKDRKSSRAFSPEPLPLPLLSNLLWAAFGVNRPDSGRRTAPSASNRQEIDLYVVMSQGLYLYEAKGHLLKPVLPKDLRSLAGYQSFVKEAPINIIYVADLSKTGGASTEQREIYSGADTGAIVQNVYLFCASEGLATVVRAMIDRSTLSKAMELRSDQKIILAQSVGFPKK